MSCDDLGLPGGSKTGQSAAALCCDRATGSGKVHHPWQPCPWSEHSRKDHSIIRWRSPGICASEWKAIIITGESGPPHQVVCRSAERCSPRRARSSWSVKWETWKPFPCHWSLGNRASCLCDPATRTGRQDRGPHHRVFPVTSRSIRNTLADGIRAVISQTLSRERQEGRVAALKSDATQPFETWSAGKTYQFLPWSRRERNTACVAGWCYSGIADEKIISPTMPNQVQWQGQVPSLPEASSFWTSRMCRSGTKPWALREQKRWTTEIDHILTACSSPWQCLDLNFTWTRLPGWVSGQLVLLLNPPIQSSPLSRLKSSLNWSNAGPQAHRFLSPRLLWHVLSTCRQSRFRVNIFSQKGYISTCHSNWPAGCDRWWNDASPGVPQDGGWRNGMIWWLGATGGKSTSSLSPQRDNEEKSSTWWPWKILWSIHAQRWSMAWRNSCNQSSFTSPRRRRSITC